MIDDIDIEEIPGTDSPVETDPPADPEENTIEEPSPATPGDDAEGEQLPAAPLEELSLLEEESEETEEVIEDRFFLTTPFNDYSVSEGLLLCIVLAIIIKGFISLVKEGFRWLRW